MSNPNGRVFISHASKDKDVAEVICHHLESCGIRTWIAPRDVAPGMEWPEAVSSGLSTCLVLVLVFSSHAIESPQVRREVERAGSKGKTIITIRIEDVEPLRGLDFFLSNTQWIDALSEPTEQQLGFLVKSIQQHLITLEGLATRLANQRQPDVTPPPGLVPKPKPIRPKTGAAATTVAGFDSAARGVIDVARKLAARCRSETITHRLLMAAFVLAPNGYASRLCRAMGVDPQLLWALLLAMSYQNQDGHEEDEVPDGSLEFERCGPVLAAAMAKAREIATDPQSVSERDLFRAFCKTADPAFVEFLRTTSQDEALEPIELNLEECRTLDPDHPGLLAGLSLRARTAVHEAHRLAQQQGLMPIPNRMFLAAFIKQPSGLLSSLLKLDGTNARKLWEVLASSSSGVARPDFPLNQEACARIVTPTIAKARELLSSGEFITERLLLQAFCEVAEPLLKDALLKIGINLDAVASREPPQAPVREKPKKPNPGSTPSSGLN